MHLRAQIVHMPRKASESALVNAKAQCTVEASARQREEAARGQAERERDSALTEAERLSATERSLAERLRIAEHETRAAFERERLQNALAAAEELERDMLQRMAKAEIQGRDKAASAESAMQAAMQAAKLENQRLTEQLEKAEAARKHASEASPDLSTRLRALEKAVTQERAQTKRSDEALRESEAKLAELDRLARENSELREQQAESAREAKWQAGREDEAKGCQGRTGGCPGQAGRPGPSPGGKSQAA